MIFLENVQRKPVFACDSPQLTDRLPLNMTAPDQVLCKRAPEDKNIAVADPHDNQMTEYWLCAQAAQAAYLLQLVIGWILDEATTFKTRQVEAEKLENSIRSFTVSLLQQPRILEFDGCGPYSICMR